MKNEGLDYDGAWDQLQKNRPDLFEALSTPA